MSAVFTDTGRALGYTNTAPADTHEPRDAHQADAEALLLADMELFSDFISCHGKRHISSERITRIPAMVESRLQAADTAEVLHLLLNSEHPAAIELRRRYLADNAEGVQVLAMGFALEDSLS